MAPRVFVCLSVLLLSACAQTPVPPAVPAADPAQRALVSATVSADARYAVINEVRRDFEAALEASRAGYERTARGRREQGLARLREAWSACMAEQPACDPVVFTDAYESLLRLQAERILVLDSDLREPARREPELVSGELEPGGVLTVLPEAGRSINLLNGTELSQIIGLNGPVQAALETWLTWMRPNLMEAWENYQFMRHLMWPHYEQAGLPEALLFGILAKESGGKVHAVSRAGASGPLQFMPATGRRFGLGVVNGFDTRFDPSESTRANVAYLNEQFRLLNNNLELVLAAYNGGENRVRRLVQSTGRSSFWDDEIFWALPSETRDYVPMVLAAAWLFMHPEDYRLEFPEVDTRAGTITLAQPQALSELAICLGSSGSRAGWFRVLRNLNPRLNPSEKQPAGTEIALPAKLVEVYQRDCVDGPFQQMAQALHAARRPSGPQLTQYVVQRGDTLSGIARKLRCANVRQLADLNNIPPPNYPLRVGQRLQLPACG